jgi:hypothetical protein
MSGNGNSSTLLVGIEINPASMQNSMEIIQKLKTEPT